MPEADFLSSARVSIKLRDTAWSQHASASINRLSCYPACNVCPEVRQWQELVVPASERATRFENRHATGTRPRAAGEHCFKEIRTVNKIGQYRDDARTNIEFLFSWKFQSRSKFREPIDGKVLRRKRSKESTQVRETKKGSGTEPYLVCFGLLFTCTLFGTLLIS